MKVIHTNSRINVYKCLIIHVIKYQKYFSGNKRTPVSYSKEIYTRVCCLYSRLSELIFFFFWVLELRILLKYSTWVNVLTFTCWEPHTGINTWKFKSEISHKQDTNLSLYNAQLSSKILLFVWAFTQLHNMFQSFILCWNYNGLHCISRIS